MFGTVYNFFHYNLLVLKQLQLKGRRQEKRGQKKGQTISSIY